MTWPWDGPSPSSGFLPVSHPLDTFPDPEQNSPENMFRARRDERDNGKWVQQVARVSLYDKTVMQLRKVTEEPLGHRGLEAQPPHSYVPPSPRRGTGTGRQQPQGQWTASPLPSPVPHRSLWVTSTTHLDARIPKLGAVFDSDLSLTSKPSAQHPTSSTSNMNLGSDHFLPPCREPLAWTTASSLVCPIPALCPTWHPQGSI